MNSAPLVHVIVINWNGLEHLEACFDSLLASDYPAFQAVLTDNGSADGSVAFAREKWGDDPRFSALELGANLGWSGGNNAALRQAIAAGARYALLLNNDVRVAPDAISRAVARAESDPRIGAVALKMVLFGQPWILNSLGVAVSRAGVGWDIGAGRLDSMVTPPDAAPGACGGACLLRLEALEQVGLLPERFGIYLDDLDLCLRLWDAGWKVACCPDAVVEHKFSASMGHGAGARRKYFLATRNRLLLLARNTPFSALPDAAAATLTAEIRSLGAAARDGAWWKWAAHARAWLEALSAIPETWVHRRAMDRQGIDRHRHCRMVRREPMFGPEVVLPVQGFYPLRPTVTGAARAISRKAWLGHPPAGMRVRLEAPLRGIPPCPVTIHLDQTPVARLERPGDSFILPENIGRVCFESLGAVRAEETGLPWDTGAWLTLDPDPAAAFFEESGIAAAFRDTGDRSGSS